MAYRPSSCTDMPPMRFARARSQRTTTTAPAPTPKETTPTPAPTPRGHAMPKLRARGTVADQLEQMKAKRARLADEAARRLLGQMLSEIFDNDDDDDDDDSDVDDKHRDIDGIDHNRECVGEVHVDPNTETFGENLNF